MTAAPARGVAPIINNYISSNAQVATTTKKGPNGQHIITNLITDAVLSDIHNIGRIVRAMPVRTGTRRI